MCSYHRHTIHEHFAHLYEVKWCQMLERDKIVSTATSGFRSINFIGLMVLLMILHCAWQHERKTIAHHTRIRRRLIGTFGTRSLHWEFGLFSRCLLIGFLPINISSDACCLSKVIRFLFRSMFPLSLIFCFSFIDSVSDCRGPLGTWRHTAIANIKCHEILSARIGCHAQWWPMHCASGPACNLPARMQIDFVRNRHLSLAIGDTCYVIIDHTMFGGLMSNHREF